PTIRHTPTAAVATQAAHTGTSVPTAGPQTLAPGVPQTSNSTAATPVPQTSSFSAATPMPQASTGPSVALTFDAGADRGYAEDILDVLLETRVLASFGVTGNWAKANPDLVRRMVAHGHLVFNHTLDHRSFTGVSDGH